MKAVWSDIVVEAFEGDDGMDCEQTLLRLAHREREQVAEGDDVQLIVVGHCEAQVDLARSAGMHHRIKTPFCGIAVFEMHSSETNVQWKLLKEPTNVVGGVSLYRAASSRGS